MLYYEDYRKSKIFKNLNIFESFPLQHVETSVIDNLNKIFKCKIYFFFQKM